MEERSVGKRRWTCGSESNRLEDELWALAYEQIWPRERTRRRAAEATRESAGQVSRTWAKGA